MLATQWLADYDTLRALDADNVSAAPSMSEEEINALPVHKYKNAGPQRYFFRIICLGWQKTFKICKMKYGCYDLVFYNFTKFVIVYYQSNEKCLEGVKYVWNS